MIRIFEFGDKTMAILKACIAIEISRTESSTGLFRRNSISTKLLAAFSKLMGHDYLCNTLGPTIQNIIAENLTFEVILNLKIQLENFNFSKFKSIFDIFFYWLLNRNFSNRFRNSVLSSVLSWHFQVGSQQASQGSDNGPKRTQRPESFSTIHECNREIRWWLSFTFERSLSFHASGSSRKIPHIRKFRRRRIHISPVPMSCDYLAGRIRSD